MHMNSSSTLQTENWRRSRLRDRERWQPRSFLVSLHHHPAEILYHPKLCCCIALTEETWRIQKYHVMHCGSIWKSWIPLWIQLWIQSPKHGYNCGSICKLSTTTATKCFKQKGSQISSPRIQLWIQSAKRGYNSGSICKVSTTTTTTTAQCFKKMVVRFQKHGYNSKSIWEV